MPKETLYNGFVKIAPMEHHSFIPSEQVTYNEIGTVLAKDEKFCKEWGVNLEIGSKVKFDRFLAYKVPVEGKDDFEWYVKFSEIISATIEDGQ